MQGWVSFHRKMMDNPVFADPFMFKLWALCLFKASHQPHEMLVGHQLVKLERGQFVTGRDALAADFNKGMKKNIRVSGYALWRWLRTLETMQMLHINSHSKFSVVTIDKYDIYNNVGDEDAQQFAPKVHNKRTSNAQQVHTNNNGNKGNNENQFSTTSTTTPGFGQICTMFENEGFGTLSQITGEMIEDLIKTYTAAWVHEAMRRAVIRGRRNLGYVNGILRDWQANGEIDQQEPKPKSDLRIKLSQTRTSHHVKPETQVANADERYAKFFKQMGDANGPRNDTG